MKIKTGVASFTAFIMLSLIGFGVYRAMHSSLFIIRTVEIEKISETQPPITPIDDDRVGELAGIRVGEENLFQLDLAALEKKILRASRWIEKVELRKVFPQTLSIAVHLRIPRLIHQDSNGDLVYIDAHGEVIAQVSPHLFSDYPVVGGVDRNDITQLSRVVRWLDRWGKVKEVGDLARVSSLTWDDRQGFRALVVYPASSSLKKSRLSRSVVDLGQEIDEDQNERIERLGDVIRYLMNRSTAAERIWLGDAKKIVVKIETDS